MLRPGVRVEVRCHAGCAWMTGFEIVALVPDDGGERAFLVRRAGATDVLPIALPEVHLRPAPALVASR